MSQTREQPNHPFDRLVVSHNPTAFSHDAAKLQTDALHNQGIVEVVYVETSRSAEKTHAAALPYLTENSLYAVIGGDESKQAAARGRLLHGSQNFPSVPLAFFEGGNVDDGFAAFNGHSAALDILLHGTNSRIRLIDVLLNYPDGSGEQLNALNYAGIGGGAESCFGHSDLKKNAKEHWFSELEAVRRVREGIHSIKVAGQYPGLKIVEKDGKVIDDPAQVQDVTCWHGSSFATFKTHTDHWQEELEVITARGKGIGRTALLALGMMTGLKHGEMAEKLSMKVRAVEGGTVPLELDGGASRIPDDTRVTFSLSEGSVLVRAMRGPHGPRESRRARGRRALPRTESLSS